jgi:transposase
LGLRDDYDAGALRTAAKRSKDGPQARRLLALAAIYDGSTRTEAAKIGGVGLQVVSDWVLKFNAHAPDGLIDRKAPGQPPRLNDAHRAALAAIIESGPIPAVHSCHFSSQMGDCQESCARAAFHQALTKRHHSEMKPAT